MSSNPDYSRVYTVKSIKMVRADIMKFLGELHTIQSDYIEEALSKSDMKESKEVIDRIRSLK